MKLTREEAFEILEIEVKRECCWDVAPKTATA
jgi:hypothetical protein